MPDLLYLCETLRLCVEFFFEIREIAALDENDDDPNKPLQLTAGSCGFITVCGVVVGFDFDTLRYSIQGFVGRVSANPAVLVRIEDRDN